MLHFIIELAGVFLLVGLFIEVMLLYSAFSNDLVDGWSITLRLFIFCCSVLLIFYYAKLVREDRNKHFLSLVNTEGFNNAYKKTTHKQFNIFNGILTEKFASEVNIWSPMYLVPAALIVLYNPIFQFPLGRNIWRVIDGMAGIVFPMLFILVSRKVVEKDEELVKGAALNELKSHADIMTDQDPIDALEKRLTELETLVSFFEEERHRVAREKEKDTYKVDISRLQYQVEDLYQDDKEIELRTAAQFKALQDKIEKLEREIEALKNK